MLHRDSFIFSIIIPVQLEKQLQDPIKVIESIHPFFYFFITLITHSMAPPPQCQKQSKICSGFPFIYLPNKWALCHQEESWLRGKVWVHHWGWRPVYHCHQSLPNISTNFMMSGMLSSCWCLLRHLWTTSWQFLLLRVLFLPYSEAWISHEDYGSQTMCTFPSGYPNFASNSSQSLITCPQEGTWHKEQSSWAIYYGSDESQLVISQNWCFQKCQQSISAQTQKM